MSGAPPLFRAWTLMRLTRGSISSTLIHTVRLSMLATSVLAMVFSPVSVPLNARVSLAAANTWSTGRS